MTAPALRLSTDGMASLPKRIRLTEARVRDQVCPPGKQQVFIYDADCKGLALRVGRNGGKSWYWIGRVKGKHVPVRQSLGDVMALTVDDARKKAREVGVKALNGIDPNEEVKESLSVDRARIAERKTLDDLWVHYRDDHLMPKAAPHTIKTDCNRYKNHLADWSDKPISQITYAAMCDLHRQLTTLKTPNVADKAVKLLRRILAFHNIRPTPERDRNEKLVYHGDEKRDKYLKRDEVRRLLNALDNAPNQTAADAIRFAIFTGARKGNVCAARWADIDMDHHVWRIPKDQSKSRKPMSIPLTPESIDVLRRRQAGDRTDPVYVFPGKVSGRPLTELKYTWNRVRRAARIDCHFHDLRHTLASWLAMSGESLLTIQKQLGHADIQSTARYSHLETSTAGAATARALANMMGTPPDNPGKKTRTRRKAPPR